MKKLSTLTFSFITMATFCFAQDAATEEAVKDSTWTKGGKFNLTFSQSNYTDWAAGGEDSYSFNSKLALFAHRNKNKSSWENNLDLAYGLANQSNLGIRKTDDLAELTSKYGYQANKKWYYTAIFNTKSQFADGYKYSDVDSIPDLVISKPFTPLYLNFSLGMDYKPNKHFSLYLSPINSKNVYVSDTVYGVRYSIEPNKHMRHEFGAYLNCKFEKEIVKNVNLLSKLNLFADYLEFEGAEDIDVSWEVLVDIKVFKIISVNLNTHLIWDNDVKSVNDDGTLGDAKLQFKEVFGAGIAYSF